MTNGQDQPQGDLMLPTEAMIAEVEQLKSRVEGLRLTGMHSLERTKGSGLNLLTKRSCSESSRVSAKKEKNMQASTSSNFKIQSKSSRVSSREG